MKIGKYENIPTNPSRLFFGNKYEEFLTEITQDIKNSSTGINSHLFFLIHQDVIVGAIQIRHSINHPNLIEDGGHIGYGISPEYRKMGFASNILKLGLIEAKKIGLKNILITCEIDNIASKKVIEKNGCQFDRITKDGKKYRYTSSL